MKPDLLSSNAPPSNGAVKNTSSSLVLGFAIALLIGGIGGYYLGAQSNSKNRATNLNADIQSPSHSSTVAAPSTVTTTPISTRPVVDIDNFTEIGTAICLRPNGIPDKTKKECIIGILGRTGTYKLNLAKLPKEERDKLKLYYNAKYVGTLHHRLPGEREDIIGTIDVTSIQTN